MPSEPNTQNEVAELRSESLESVPRQLHCKVWASIMLTAMTSSGAQLAIEPRAVVLQSKARMSLAISP